MTLVSKTDFSDRKWLYNDKNFSVSQTCPAQNEENMQKKKKERKQKERRTNIKDESVREQNWQLFLAIDQTQGIFSVDWPLQVDNR